MFEEFCFSLHSVQALWLWHTKIGLSVFLGRHVLKLIGLFFFFPTLLGLLLSGCYWHEDIDVLFRVL